MNKSNLYIILGVIVLGLALYNATRTAEPSHYNCGNERCESGEDALSCTIDCGPPQSHCGNNVCEYPENEYTCSSDCDQIIPTLRIKKCGDEICQTTETAQSCPIDCGTPSARGTVCFETDELSTSGITDQCFDNALIVPNLNKKNRPLIQGTVFHMKVGDGDKFDVSICTIGAIIQIGGKNYILTAGHCVTDNTNNIPDSGDLNREIMQEDSDVYLEPNNVVGKVKKWDSTGRNDVALIEIDSGIPFSTKSFLDDTINGFKNPEIGMEVFKVGRTTGLTFGTVVEIRKNLFIVEGKNGEIFTGKGDSGSAIMTVANPTQIVGVISIGIQKQCDPLGFNCKEYSNDGGKTTRRVTSPLPQNIINSLGIM